MHERNFAMPTVSVITPLYNSSTCIVETLNSLRRQTYENWESILIDDGSTDDTAEKVRPFLEDKRFRYIRQENQGIAGARNSGIKAATGEWICLLDHDDRWLPAKLGRQMQFALANNCRIVCTDAFIIEGSRRWVYSQGFREVAAKLARSVRDPSIDVFELLIKLNFLCTCSVMIHRSLFDKYGLMDAGAVPADDYEMWMRCMPEERIGFLNQPLVEYYLHDGNYSKNEIRMLTKVIYVLEKKRRECANDHGRLKQFDDSLAVQYGLLFRKLMSAGDYVSALQHACALLTHGPDGLRMFSRSVGAPLLTRLKKSILFRLHLARS